MFLNSNTSLSMYLFCKSRIHVITLYSSMYVCIMHQCFGVFTSYGSWLGLTIPYLGVGCHNHMRDKYAKRDIKLEHNSMNIIAYRARYNEHIVPL
jgi:hypothetical protein